MTSKILAGIAALALTGTAVLATAGPAATAPLWAPGYYGYYDGYYPGYAYSYEPGYVYSPGYAYSQGYATGGRDDAYCAQRYRSYDPASGTFLGYDGIRHPCP